VGEDGKPIQLKRASILLQIAMLTLAKLTANIQAKMTAAVTKVVVVTTTLLTLVTLGSATQTEMILLCHTTKITKAMGAYTRRIIAAIHAKVVEPL